MASFLIGALMMAALLITIDYSRRKKLHLSWWQWGITFLAFFYTTFVLEMIAAFLKESALRAALVTGVVFGFVAVVWAVLLSRFFFQEKNRSS
jgi:hypothetical protein